MTRVTRDLEWMEHADGEALASDAEPDADGRAKIAAVRELGELVRGRIEQQAEALPDKDFADMWRAIETGIAADQRAKSLDVPVPAAAAHAAPAKLGWFERYRGHVLTAVVSAGAVAALALLLRDPSRGAPGGARNAEPINATPVSDRPSEIEELDTPGGNGTVFHLADEDGNTTVIWVTPDDTVQNL